MSMLQIFFNFNATVWKLTGGEKKGAIPNFATEKEPKRNFLYLTGRSGYSIVKDSSKYVYLQQDFSYDPGDNNV